VLLRLIVLVVVVYDLLVFVVLFLFGVVVWIGLLAGGFACLI